MLLYIGYNLMAITYLLAKSVPRKTGRGNSNSDSVQNYVLLIPVNTKTNFTGDTFVFVMCQIYSDLPLRKFHNEHISQTV